ncbi:hypothetical protein Tco_0236316 [Tanacetum coccineum]
MSRYASRQTSGAGPSSNHFIDEWEMDSKDSTVIAFAIGIKDSAVTNFIYFVGVGHDGDRKMDYIVDTLSRGRINHG